MFDVALVREGEAVLVCKRLSSRALREPVARAAFAREVELLSRVRSPVLPAVVRAGDDERGPFVIETRAGGGSLRAGAELLRARGVGVPGNLVAEIADRAARALAELHEVGDDDGPLDIVHGDLTPDHVFRGEGGAIRFVDFGAARFRGMRGVATYDRGTLPFAAPEVARGEVEPAREHDVYALAATLVAFGAPRPLTRATSDGALLLEIGERGLDLDIVDEVPLTALGRAALRAALAFDPKARLSSARELALNLRFPAAR
jgi:serine/threonine-protein kinase